MASGVNASEKPRHNRFLQQRQLPVICHPIEGGLAITAARPSTVVSAKGQGLGSVGWQAGQNLEGGHHVTFPFGITARFSGIMWCTGTLLQAIFKHPSWGLEICRKSPWDYGVCGQPLTDRHRLVFYVELLPDKHVYVAKCR